jgi:hypothetical protein
MAVVLNILCPVIFDEAERFATRMARILQDLNAANFNYKVLIVLQSKTADNGPLERLALHPNVIVRRTARYSVSHARNVALEHVRKSSENYVYFLDASVVPTEDFWYLFKENAASQLSAWVCSINWTDLAPKTNGFGSHIRGLGYLFPKMYVWACVFRADVVGDTRFDEDVGPGENTTTKSGEDFLFVQDILVNRNIRQLPYYPTVVVNHPPRPEDFSKHLTYAGGQGRMYRRLLLSPAPISFKAVYAMYAFFFLVNGLLRLFLFKEKSIQIMAQRLTGLFVGK